jgi:hypothetical protein
MVTDGDQTGIPFGVPAGLAAWSDHGVNYHFVVAKDRIRFLRDNTLPVLFFDFASEIPHRFRLELIGDQSYAFYIDDELMDTGVPEGPFPIPNPGLNISTRARTEPTTTAWDYIRYGEIPEDGSGDFDSSGVLDLRDFYFVHECVIDGGPGTDARRGCHFADMDFDGDVDLNDFATFQTLFGD